MLNSSGENVKCFSHICRFVCVKLFRISVTDNLIADKNSIYIRTLTQCLRTAYGFERFFVYFSNRWLSSNTESSRPWLQDVICYGRFSVSMERPQAVSFTLLTGSVCVWLSKDRQRPLWTWFVRSVYSYKNYSSRLNWRMKLSILWNTFLFTFKLTE